MHFSSWYHVLSIYYPFPPCLLLLAITMFVIASWMLWYKIHANLKKPKICDSLLSPSLFLGAGDCDLSQRLWCSQEVGELIRGSNAGRHGLNGRPLWGPGRSGEFNCHVRPPGGTKMPWRNPKRVQEPGEDPKCEAWCWYIYLQNWVIYGVNVGKYSSTMVRIWVWTDVCCWISNQ